MKEAEEERRDREKKLSNQENEERRNVGIQRNQKLEIKEAEVEKGSRKEIEERRNVGIQELEIQKKREGSKKRD